MPMHSGGTGAESAAGLAGGDSGKFFGDLANGLHAMAQPLTILRASMEVLALPPSAGVDQRRYLEISTSQLERACHLFTCVQDLVAVKIVEAQKKQFDLWELITPLIEGQKGILQASGVAIAVARQEACCAILGDPGRTEQAVAAALQMAAELASRGGVIEVSAAQGGGFAELTLRNTSRHGRSLDSSARLSVALAEANVLSQGGKYEFAEDPLRVSMALPVEEAARAGKETPGIRWDAERMH
jgi:hypothetical protein